MKYRGPAKPIDTHIELIADKGGVSTVNTDKYLVVYDNVAQGYRSVNKDTIVSVTCKGLTINNNNKVVSCKIRSYERYEYGFDNMAVPTVS